MAKRKYRKQASCSKVELVFGGGGVRGFSHFGFLQAVDELQISVGNVLGVSVGSIVASFYANGYTHGEIAQIFRDGLNRTWPDEVNEKLRVGQGIIDMKVVTKYLVAEYDLKPRPNLSVLAYSPAKLRPVLFEGTDYNLSTALAASCAVPGVMKPVWDPKQGYLVDGGVHHPHPGHFCTGPAIISKLGYAHHLPTEGMSPTELWFHSLEVMGSQFLNWYFPDPVDHIIVETGLPSVACLTFSVSEAKCKQMIEHAYKKTMATLVPAIKDGRVPLIK